MLETGTSGLMSGAGKRGGAWASALAPSLDSTPRGPLQIALNSAIENDRLHRNVAQKCKLPELTRRKGHALTSEECQRFFTALAGHRHEGLFTLIVGVGLRRGEALALSLADFDESAEVLHVRHTLQRIDGELKRVKPKSNKT